MSVYMIGRVQTSYFGTLDAKGTTIEMFLARLSAIPLLINDHQTIKDFIEEISNDDEVQHAIVYDLYNHAVAKMKPTQQVDPLQLQMYTREILHNKKIVGKLEIGLSTVNYVKAVERDVIHLIAFFLGSMVIGLVVALLISRTISRPIKQITRAAIQAGKGDLTARFDNDRLVRCWELKGCTKTACPAHGKQQHRCWLLPGTLSGRNQALDEVAKREKCSDCQVYQMAIRDEIYNAGENFNLMLASIRQIFSHVIMSAEQMWNMSESLSSFSGKIQQGSSSQSRSVRDTNESIHQLAQRMVELADGATEINESAKESATSLVDLSSAVSQMGDEAASLSDQLAAITSAIDKMNTDIGNVAGNEDALMNQLNESAQNVGKIEATIQDIDRNTATANHLAQQVTQGFYREGQASVHAASDGMSKLRDMVLKVSTDIDNLRVKSNDIEAVLTVIHEVTDQTNLLSLNAAIIAAQSGTHGRAFAVVANEIKQLAASVRRSTKEIEQLIISVQESVESASESVESGQHLAAEGVQLVNAVDQTLAKVANAAADSANASTQIALSTKEQVKNIRHLVETEDTMVEKAKLIALSTRELVINSTRITEAVGTIQKKAQHVRTSTRSQAEFSEKLTRGSNTTADISQRLLDVIQTERDEAKTIASHVAQVNQVAIENLSATDELSRIVDELNRQSIQFKQGLSHFKIEDSD